MVSALTGGRSSATDTTLPAFSTMISLMHASSGVVAGMECGATSPRGTAVPDFASLHPGYDLRGQRSERRRDPRWQRELVGVERHRHHRVVADQRSELDHADHAPERQRAPIGLLGHAAAVLQLARIVVDRESFGIGGRRAVAGEDYVNHGARHAGLERKALVQVPFELAAPALRGDQDRDLAQPRRQGSAIAEQLAELLPLVGELGPVQRGEDRPLHLAARTGGDGVVDLALLRGHPRIWRYQWYARHLRSPVR